MIFYKKVIGHSMDLFIVEGDKVVYSDLKEYSFGDIIIYKNPKTDELVCHRFLKKIGHRYLIAGDNNTYFEFVKDENIVGKGIMLIRTNKITCDLEKISQERTRYCKYLLKCVIVGCISRKLKVLKPLYSRTIIRRSKIQVKYINDICKAKDFNNE